MVINLIQVLSHCLIVQKYDAAVFIRLHFQRIKFYISIKGISTKKLTCKSFCSILQSKESSSCSYFQFLKTTSSNRDSLRYHISSTRCRSATSKPRFTFSLSTQQSQLNTAHATHAIHATRLMQLIQNATQ